MAENDSPVNGTNEKSSPAQSEQGSQEEQLTELTGWMMKRSKVTHKWKRQFFRLKNTELLYGNSEQTQPKSIPLVSAEIGECNIDNKENAFRIKPSNSKRTYYIQAEDEASQHNWMQAICFAKAAGRTEGDPSQACVLQ